MDGAAQAGETIGATRARLVIAASSLGTVFEWYDFFIYGTLAPILGALFFPATSGTAQFLAVLATFGIGFGMRPVGAVLFGWWGDRRGRKSTFLATVTLMALATAAIGVLPGYSEIGDAAPVALVLLRIAQGLAMGGEYGGAAVYVAEHAPRHRRGLYTSFIQASVIGGFLLSLAVTLGTRWAVGVPAWEAWGWRIPFLVSLLLLALTLWMRVRLAETPIFRAVKAAGRIAANPLRETFADGRVRARMLVALFGVAAGLTVIWYTAQFGVFYFLQNAEHVADEWVRLLVGIGAAVSLGWFVLFGHLSDRYGRKPLIVAGYGLTLILLFPLFHLLASGANPLMREAARRAPVVVSGPDCVYRPLRHEVRRQGCGRILDHLAGRGVFYAKQRTPGIAVTVGGVPVADRSDAGLDRALTRAGWPIAPTRPGLGGAVRILIAVVGLGMLSGLTYGPVAALLAELFPARVRFSAVSIPYHLGTALFGGFMPFISAYIVVRTGDPFSGLWYSWLVVAMALVVAILFLPETRGADLDR